MVDDRVEVARAPSEDEIHELGLVVLSQRTPYWVEETEDGFHLLVRESRAAAIGRQIELYRMESANWPPTLPQVQENNTSVLHALSWATLLVACQSISLEWISLRDTLRLSAEAVMEGEVYRCFTALLLHGDFGHLAGNAFFGGVFLHLVVRQAGGGMAWVGILLAGTLGNFLNAWAHYPSPHASIGASTAVFGAVGMLVALPAGLLLRERRWYFYKAWAIPLVTGLVFLAWFGTGDDNTDTTAHLMGFLCGLPMGVLAGWFAAGRRRASIA